ncbi:hypothetical protein FGADI_12824, partial [Fusarium gaditjirri]
MENTKILKTFKPGSDLEHERFLSFLSKLYEDFKELDTARKHRLDALEILEKVEGKRSLSWLKGAVALARINGRLEENLEIPGDLQEENALKPGDCDKNKLAEESEHLLKQALKGFEDGLGEYSTKTLQTCTTIGEYYLDHKKMDKAEEYYVKAFEGFDKARGRDYKRTFRVASTLGAIYFQNHKYDKAKEMLLTAHEGFFSEASKSKNIHMEYLGSTIELAQCYGALAGPSNEKTGIKYFDKALEYLREHGASESEHAALVRIRQGNLRRQLREFNDAQFQIEHAIDFFNKDLPPGSGQYQAQYWEIYHASEKQLDKVNPEDYIAMAHQGLVDRLGSEDQLTLQATILLGELALDHDSKLDPKRDEYLRQALATCLNLLPPGSPTTIRIMDRLITYWTANNAENIYENRINDTKKSKWEALRAGYGADVAVAIMKMTDPKRENLFSYDEADDNNAQFDKEVPDEEQVSDNEEDLSEDEDLTFWNDSAVQNVLAGQTEVQQQLSNLLRAGIELPANVVQAVTAPLLGNANAINASNAMEPDDESSDEEEDIQVTRSQPLPAGPMTQIVDQSAMVPQPFVQPVEAVMAAPLMACQELQNGVQQFIPSAFNPVVPQAGFSMGIGIPGLIGVQAQAGIGYQNANTDQDENGARDNSGQQQVFG